MLCGMVIDNNAEFGSGLSIALAAGTTLLGDVIDMGAVPDAAELYLVILVETAAASAGAATAQFTLASDAQGAIATDGSATAHCSTGALPLAALTAGAMVACLPLPRLPRYERYLGLLLTIGTATITSGKVTAFLTNDPSTYRPLADNI